MREGEEGMEGEQADRSGWSACKVIDSHRSVFPNDGIKHLYFHWLRNAYHCTYSAKVNPPMQVLNQINR